MGASYIAANYTAGVKVKKLVFNDGPNYDVNYYVKQQDGPYVLEEKVLFPKKTNYGTKTAITLPDLKNNLEIGLTVKDDL